MASNLTSLDTCECDRGVVPERVVFVGVVACSHEHLLATVQTYSWRIRNVVIDLQSGLLATGVRIVVPSAFLTLKSNHLLGIDIILDVFTGNRIMDKHLANSH